MVKNTPITSSSYSKILRELYSTFSVCSADPNALSGRLHCVSFLASGRTLPSLVKISLLSLSKPCLSSFILDLLFEMPLA